MTVSILENRGRDGRCKREQTTEPTFPTRIPETDDGANPFSVPFPSVLDAESLAALKGMAPIIIKQPYQIDYIHSFGQDSPFFAGLAGGGLLGGAWSRRPATPTPIRVGMTSTRAPRPTGLSDRTP